MLGTKPVPILEQNSEFNTEGNKDLMNSRLNISISGGTMGYNIWSFFLNTLIKYAVNQRLLVSVTSFFVFANTRLHVTSQHHNTNTRLHVTSQHHDANPLLYVTSQCHDITLKSIAILCDSLCSN